MNATHCQPFFYGLISSSWGPATRIRICSEVSTDSLPTVSVLEPISCSMPSRDSSGEAAEWEEDFVWVPHGCHP